MDDMQKAAYIIAMAACANIEAQGMMAENQVSLHLSSEAKYTKEDFDALADKYGIHHNAVLTLFRS